jgi:DUF4097 and DUF4098 domain-containing protein YvlB
MAERVHHTFATDRPPTLEIRLASGDVVIETLDTTETEVELDAANDAAAELIDEVRVEDRATTSEHIVYVEVPERRGFGLRFLRTPEFRVRIRCPHGARVDLRSRSADLDARGRLGDLRVKTASGDTEAQEVEGSAEVASASGDVEIDSVGGRVDISTASGDVRVGHAGGRLRANLVSGDLAVGGASESVEATTVSGDQQLDSVERGTIALRSVSGDVSVAVRRGVTVWFDIRSVSGDTRSKLDPADGAPEGGAPALELRVNTVSGDVRVLRTA